MSIKHIEFISPADGDVLQNPDVLFLKILIMYVNEEFWCSGSGVTELNYQDQKLKSYLEIYFNVEFGFYIRYKSWQEDYHSLGLGDLVNIVSVYVGGDPVLLPTKFFVTREEALLVVKEFCQTGKRTDKINWGKDQDINWHYGYKE